MAYMSTENAARIRKQLRAAFPDFKISVRKDDSCLGVTVSIMAGPVRFEDRDYAQLNPHALDRHQNSHILKAMMAIIDEGNWDRSDPMTDYWDVGWYVHLNQGTWERPYILTNPEEEEAA